tara:strand:- start:2066 stop:3067 length:1002 start_codon:yes stop_codon:yes gene_type:complete
MKLTKETIITLAVALMIGAMIMLDGGKTVVEVNYEGVESAGKFMPGEDNDLNGNAYVLADDKAMDTVQASTDAYNARDWDAMKALYRDEFVENSAEGMTDYFDNEVETLNMDIYAMLPVKIQGSDITRVLTWATEDRTFQNGSKERHELFEIYYIDEEGKLGGWNQWNQVNPDPELTTHGLSQGGKFIGRTENENSGKPFVFSNRSEVETLEKMFEAANNMDIDALKEFVAEEMRYEGSEGQDVIITHKDWEEMFSGRVSNEWKPWAMIPLKIADTDPTSGVIAFSNAKIEWKNGNSFEADLSELYFFDLDGKINGVQQYSKALPDLGDESDQ